MTPHVVMDSLDEALLRLNRGEECAAALILERLLEQAKQEALELDRWGDRYAEAQDVIAEYRFD